MHVGTDAEVMQFLSANQWNYGIKTRAQQLYYDMPEANRFELKFPDLPGRAAYFSRRAARLGVSDDLTFYGAALWITYAELGSLSPIGWRIIEKMRQGFGENRSLQNARAHFFRENELQDLEAFLLPCFIFGWDAYLMPFASNDFFVHVSHDEYWGVVSKTEEAHQKLLKELSDLDPIESESMRRRFCFPKDV